MADRSKLATSLKKDGDWDETGLTVHPKRSKTIRPNLTLGSNTMSENLAMTANFRRGRHGGGRRGGAS